MILVQNILRKNILLDSQRGFRFFSFVMLNPQFDGHKFQPQYYINMDLSSNKKELSLIPTGKVKISLMLVASCFGETVRKK